jgi:uncharacterized damage-inducible protein DinB
MLRRIEDFQKNWEYEADATGKVMRALTDASLRQKVSSEGRDLGFLAWHLAHTIGEMLGKVGINVDAPAEGSSRPESAAEIAEAYEKAAASVNQAIGDAWTDATLEQTDDMYGETWSRGLTLFYLIAHQAHHRGQMTVLMRQAGVAVPGIYGPSKEEWEAFGMPPHP